MYWGPNGTALISTSDYYSFEELPLTSTSKEFVLPAECTRVPPKDNPDSGQITSRNYVGKSPFPKGPDGIVPDLTPEPGAWLPTSCACSAAVSSLSCVTSCAASAPGPVLLHLAGCWIALLPAM